MMIKERFSKVQGAALKEQVVKNKYMTIIMKVKETKFKMMKK